jgi:hypothetical protein
MHRKQVRALLRDHPSMLLFARLTLAAPFVLSLP